MGFNLRKRFKVGPFYINTSKGRVTSWGIKLGPITKNITRGTTTVDTPGPGSYTFNRKRRR